MLVECLVSDFQGMEESVRLLATSGLDVYAHNIETVRRLQGHVRDRRAGYEQSLRVLRLAKAASPGLYTKTSIMLGLGETRDEVRETLRDLRAAQVDVVTLGQYLRPSDAHLAVERYVTPEEFDDYRQYALSLGFRYVASGPMVRSSYKAGEFFLEHMIMTDRASRDRAASFRTGHEQRRVVSEDLSLSTTQTKHHAEAPPADGANAS